MADWLRLPNGQAVNMDRVSHVVTITSVPEERTARRACTLYTPDRDIKLWDADVDAVYAYLDRVQVGERSTEERPPRGRDNLTSSQG